MATKTAIEPDIASLIKWIVGLYFAGNIGQKVADNVTAKKPE